MVQLESNKRISQALNECVRGTRNIISRSSGNWKFTHPTSTTLVELQSRKEEKKVTARDSRNFKSSEFEVTLISYESPQTAIETQWMLFFPTTQMRLTWKFSICFSISFECPINQFTIFHADEPYERIRSNGTLRYIGRKTTQTPCYFPCMSRYLK